MSDGTTCQVAYFGQKVIFSVSDVSERFKESISRFPANFKKISESRIFDLSRDPTSHRAKISLFQNMFGFIQYGSRLFGIDASSDSALGWWQPPPEKTPNRTFLTFETILNRFFVQF